MIVPLVSLGVLLLLSGFFSASETALFSLRRADRELLAEDGGRSARCVLQLLDHPRTLLVAVLFGNLLINFLFSATSARLFVKLSYAWEIERTLAVALGALTTLCLLIVCGEITPKAIAVTKPRQVALITAPVLLMFQRVTGAWLIRPLERLVAWLLDRIERRLPPREGPLQPAELRRFVELQGEEGSLEGQVSEFLADVLELHRRRVHEVMIPRVDLVAMCVDEGREAFVALVREHKLSKVLVHDGEGLDAVFGYVTLHDVLGAADDVTLKQLARPVWFVPHTKSLESLLGEMISTNRALALVVGEFGGTEGLVTLEDVVEEITGDIARHDASPLVTELPDGTWLMAGRFPIREVGELLGIELPAQGLTTLAGFLARQLGRIPEVGDMLRHVGITFRVERVDRRRVTAVRVALPLPGARRLPPLREPSGEEDVPEELTRSGARRAQHRLERFVESNPSELQETDESGERGSP